MLQKLNIQISQRGVVKYDFPWNYIFIVVVVEYPINIHIDNIWAILLS